MPSAASFTTAGSAGVSAAAVLLFAAIITVIAVAHLKFRLNAILAFWAAYVITRPLGASIGDLLSQPRKIGPNDDPAAFL